MIRSFTLIDAILDNLIDAVEGEGLADISEPLREARARVRDHLDRAELHQLRERAVHPPGVQTSVVDAGTEVTPDAADTREDAAPLRW